jgi:hypothetical protein
VQVRLIFVVTQGEYRLTVLRPGRGDPDAIAVVLRIWRPLANKHDCAIAHDRTEVLAEEAPVIEMRRERNDAGRRNADGSQRRIGYVIVGAA